MPPSPKTTFHSKQGGLERDDNEDEKAISKTESEQLAEINIE